MFADIAKAVHILSTQYLQKRKTGDKKNDSRKATSFRRKGALSKGTSCSRNSLLKKKKSLLPWSTSGSSGNSKVTEARAAKPCCGPVTRYRPQEWAAQPAPGRHTHTQCFPTQGPAWGMRCGGGGGGRAVKDAPVLGSGDSHVQQVRAALGSVLGAHGIGWKTKALEMAYVGNACFQCRVG